MMGLLNRLGTSRAVPFLMIGVGVVNALLGNVASGVIVAVCGGLILARNMLGR